MRQRGFSLIEVLVTIAIAGFSLYRPLGPYAVAAQYDRLQGTNSEMQQNLRAAVDQDIERPHGCRARASVEDDGERRTNDDLVRFAWVSLRLVGKPDRSDRMYQRAGGLAQQRGKLGDTTLTLATGWGASFSAGMFVSIGGVECAKVTAVAGDVLTVDTEPFRNDAYSSKRLPWRYLHLAPLLGDLRRDQQHSYHQRARRKWREDGSYEDFGAQPDDARRGRDPRDAQPDRLRGERGHVYRDQQGQARNLPHI